LEVKFVIQQGEIIMNEKGMFSHEHVETNFICGILAEFNATLQQAGGPRKHFFAFFCVCISPG
jgi:hypothetical protein